MFRIHRAKSRFARGPVANAIDKVQDHHDLAYADEDAALRRIAEELCMLSDRYRIDPEFRTARHTDGSSTITCDPLGVTYRVVPL